MIDNKKTFGEYLRLKRTDMGFTQKSFADKLFITESAVSKWERGLSYPDVTLITSICEILQLSEHELLTASEDVTARNHERLANKYITFLKRLKISQYAVYGAALLVCFICNIAVNHTLSWFFIVLASELLAASLTLLPVILEDNKKRGILTLAAFTAGLTVLLAVCCIYTGGDWFFVAFTSVLFGMSVVFMPLAIKSLWLPEAVSSHKAVLCLAADTILLFIMLLTIDLYTGGGKFFTAMCPITALCLILPWGMTLIIRYAGINGLFKTAGCLALLGVFNSFIIGLIDVVLGETPSRYGLKFDFGNWKPENLNGNINAVIFFTLLGLTVVFTVAGAVFELNKSKRG